MDTEQIVQSIDEEIDRLQRARSLLTGNTAPLKRGLNTEMVAHQPESAGTMSAEGRARVAAAHRARWAKAKRK